MHPYFELKHVLRSKTDPLRRFALDWTLVRASNLRNFDFNIAKLANAYSRVTVPNLGTFCPSDVNLPTTERLSHPYLGLKPVLGSRTDPLHCFALEWTLVRAFNLRNIDFNIPKLANAYSLVTVPNPGTFCPADVNLPTTERLCTLIFNFNTF